MVVVGPVNVFMNRYLKRNHTKKMNEHGPPSHPRLMHLETQSLPHPTPEGLEPDSGLASDTRLSVAEVDLAPVDLLVLDSM